jgi:tight adherence protein B
VDGGSLSLVILLVAGLVAVLIVVIGIFTARKDRSLVEERLGSIDAVDINPFTRVEDESGTMHEREQSTALKALDDILSERTFGKKWRQKLSRADLKLTVAEFFALHFISMAGVFALSYFILFSGDVIFSIIGAFIGFFIPRIVVGRRISKRLIEFENQLPDTLSLWVNALRSGYSVLQAMEAISRDAPEPTKTEFKRVVQEVQLGIDMEDAFLHMLERVESEDLDLVVTAVNIQREVGGNLSEILEVISTTIRERIKLKGEIRVLTSQGRITGYLISGLPIALAMLLNVMNPGFISPMFENRLCGWPMLGLGLALIGIGTAVIQKIVDIEI